MQSTDVTALGPRIAALPRSGIREIMDIAAQMPNVVHLEVGEPDFATPPHIVEAAARAGYEGFTKYTPSLGYATLRDAITEKLLAENRIAASADDIVVTTGAVTALFEAIIALVEPGDVVLLPDPGWPNTEAMVSLVGGVPVHYVLHSARGYEPDLDELRDISHRTLPRVIYMNSPSNPTGAVFAEETVKGMCEIAEETGAFLLSDECYEAIRFGRPHLSPASLLPRRVFTAYSFSKTYAMTGWRVGYLVTPPGLGAAFMKIQEPVISCATGVAQKAAEAALAGPQECVRKMVDAYRSRRDRVGQLLSGTGLLLTVPQGAFYAMLDVSGAATDARSFAHALLREHSVAVAPGTTFGPSGATTIRISLASSLAALETGIEAIVTAVGAIHMAER